MCINTGASISKFIFKDFDKKDINDKNNNQDNVIDLTNTKTLNSEISQKLESTVFLKVKDNNYLKLDLSSKEGKEFIDKLKSQITSQEGNSIRDSFLKLEFLEPDGISNEKLMESIKETPLQLLDNLRKENKSIDELLKNIDANKDTGKSLNFLGVSKEDLAIYMINGDKDISKIPESIKNTLNLLNNTGEWSALNTMIELNNVRKSFLDKNILDTDKKLEILNSNLQSLTNPEEINKLNNKISTLDNQKQQNISEKNDLLEKYKIISNNAMKTRVLYSKKEISQSQKKLESLDKEISLSEKKLEQLKNEPKKLDEENKNLIELKRQYNFIKLHIKTVNKDIEHDSNLLSKLISNREKAGLKVPLSEKNMATVVNNTASRNNLVLAKISINENLSVKDKTSTEEYISKAKDYNKKVEDYNPEFNKPINNSSEKKEYNEKLLLRNEYFQNKLDTSQIIRDNDINKLNNLGIKYNKGIFIPNKEDKKLFSESKFNNEQENIIINYHNEGETLLKTLNEQSKILQTELKNEGEIEPKTIEEKEAYFNKVQKIDLLENNARNIQEEQTNIVISDMKAKNELDSLNDKVKSEEEEYKQTAPSSDPKNKTKFDQLIEERSKNVDEISKFQDELEDKIKKLKGLPDSKEKIIENIREDLNNKINKLNKNIADKHKIIDQNNKEILVLYNKHKELNGSNKDITEITDKALDKFVKGSKLNLDILKKEAEIKKIDETLESVKVRAVSYVGVDPVTNLLKKETEKNKEKLLKEIESDKEKYKSLNINTTIGNVDTQKEYFKNSIYESKSNLKISEKEGKNYSDNYTLLNKAIKGNTDLETLEKGIQSHVEKQENLLDKLPDWTKNSREFQIYKANKYTQLANKKAELSNIYTFADTEPNRNMKIEFRKEKYFEDRFLSVLDKSKNLSDEEINKKAKNEINDEILDLQSGFKQVYDQEALLTLEKSEKILNQIKTESIKNFDKNNDLYNEKDLNNLTINYIKTGNSIALNIADNHPEKSVKLFKSSSKLIDDLPNTYKIGNENFSNNDLKRLLHDEIAMNSTKAISSAIKRNMVFTNKTLDENKYDSIKAASNLQKISILEADKVKNLELEEVNKKVIELEKKAIKASPEELKLINEEIKNLKNYTLKSEGAKLAYSTKENYDRLSKELISDLKEHSINLEKERINTVALYRYQINQVKDKKDEHSIFAFWANVFNGDGSYDTDKLDNNLYSISAKYHSEILQTKLFSENYQNHDSLEFISALKERIDAKKLYDKDNTVFKDEHTASIILKENKNYFNDSINKYPTNNESFNKLFLTDKKLDQTLENFVKNGGVSENNSIKSNEKNTSYYNQSLLNGGSLQDIEDIYKMDGKYSNRRLTEMFGIDPHKLAINTGVEWFDNTINDIGAFIDNPDTLELIVETAIIEVATAGAGTVLALANEVRETATVLKVAEKVNELKTAETALQAAKVGLEEAKNALELAKSAGKTGEALQNEIRAINNAEKVFEASKAKKLEAFGEWEKASKKMNSFVEKRAKEIAKQYKIDNAGFFKRNMYKGIDAGKDFVKDKVKGVVVDKVTENLAGEDQELNKLLKGLAGASSKNTLKDFSNVLAKIRTVATSNISDKAASSLGINVYAKLRHIDINNPTPSQKDELKLAGDIMVKAVNTATDFISNKLKKKEIEPDQIVADKKLKSLNLKVDKESKEYKELQKDFEDYYKDFDKTSSKKSMDKHEKLEEKLKAIYPNYEKDKKITDFLNNEKAKIITKEIIHSDSSKIGVYTQELNKTLLEFNEKNPTKTFSQEEIKTITENLVTQKIINDIKPLDIKISELNSGEAKKNFIQKVSDKKIELEEQLSKSNLYTKEEAKIIANTTMKLYLSNLYDDNNSTKETKDYLDKVNEQIEIFN